jgi:flagellar biosynthesis/type III secretory pathway M-ring protein FliF/YscJ
MVRGSLTVGCRAASFWLIMFGKRKKKSLTQTPQKMIRPAQSVRTPAKPAAPRSTREAKGAVEVTSDVFLSKLSPEAQAQLEADEKIMADVRKFVEEHPEEAGQLLRVWLKAAREGGK